MRLPTLIKHKIGKDLSKLQAIAERNRHIREGRKARISKTKGGYGVIVKEYVF